MNRKDFLKTCGFGCLATIAGISLLESCSSAQVLSKEIKDVSAVGFHEGSTEPGACLDRASQRSSVAVIIRNDTIIASPILSTHIAKLRMA